MTNNESKEGPLIIKTVNLSSKSLGKLNKMVSRLNIEFNKSRKQNTGDTHV